MITDTERLDFMVKRRAYVVNNAKWVEGCYLVFVGADKVGRAQLGFYATPRHAIDAAMSKGEQDELHR